MCLSLIERKKVTEVWLAACRKYDIHMMVQISGCPYPDVIELAKHAKSIKVDSILCLPELYFKPKTEARLVAYLKGIAEYCADIPILYYHIPMFSDVNLNMPKFCDMAEQEIQNFAGIKYTSGDLDQGSACLKDGRSIFLGCDTILCGALALGFDCSIMTTLNICPELSLKIVELVKKRDLEAALKTQRVLNVRIKEILQKGNGEWVTLMKIVFNSTVNFNVGDVRRPL